MNVTFQLFYSIRLRTRTDRWVSPPLSIYPAFMPEESNEDQGLRVNLPPSPSVPPFTISDIIARDEQPPAYNDIYRDGLPSYQELMQAQQPHPLEIRILNDLWKLR